MRLKYPIMAVLSVGAAAGGWYGWTKWRSADEGPVPTYETVEVRKGSLSQTVNTDGRVEALLTVDVKSKASGAVERILVNEADVVTGPRIVEEPISDLFDLPLYEPEKGQLLLELDPVDEQPNVNRSRAQLDAETARLEQARAELARVTETVEAELSVAEAERQAVESEIAVVDAQREVTAQDIETARTNLADSEAKLQRQRQLLAAKLTSQEEFESATTAAAKSRADLKQAEASLRGAEAKRAQARARLVQAEAKVISARAGRRQIEVQRQVIALAASNVSIARVGYADAVRRLNETRITAPINGVIVKKYVDKGQVIAGGVSNVGGGTTLLTLADINRLFVMASVPEADIALVRDPEGEVRQSVRITADAYPGESFTGEVLYRVPQATTENNVTTVKVRIEVTDRNKRKLLPGMSTNVEILAQKREGILLVPAAAVQRGEGDKRFVYVIGEDGRPKPAPITPGISSATHVEVVKGLAEGQKIVASAAAVDTAPARKGGPGGAAGSKVQNLMPRR
jgi:HlyD family secretion protein